MQIDRYDRQILAILQADGRISNQDLADRIGLSPSPCLRRVRALEDAGIVSLRRDFVERKPVTWYALSRDGRKLLDRHLKALQSLIHVAQ